MVCKTIQTLVRSIGVSWKCQQQFGLDLSHGWPLIHNTEREGSCRKSQVRYHIKPLPARAREMAYPIKMLAMVTEDGRNPMVERELTLEIRPLTAAHKLWHVGTCLSIQTHTNHKHTAQK